MFFNDTRADVLRKLAESDKEQINKLYKKVNCTYAILNRIIKEFEQKNLIKRQKCETDSRTKDITLTNEGLLFYEKFLELEKMWVIKNKN